MLGRRVVLPLLATVLALLPLSTPAFAVEHVDLEITQSAAPDPAPVGGEPTWTILVINNGWGSEVGAEAPEPPGAADGLASTGADTEPPGGGAGLAALLGGALLLAIRRRGDSTPRAG